MKQVTMVAATLVVVVLVVLVPIMFDRSQALTTVHIQASVPPSFASGNATSSAGEANATETEDRTATDNATK